ncbi:MAG: AMP-dependent synthetase [Rhodocyclaceae bacterium]|nr:AMP-binding protein [Dechloromonas sp.]TEX49704.1 MAG: AMP-dependent synthetase [Rhodocyclaceae bacterium]
MVMIPHLPLTQPTDNAAAQPDWSLAAALCAAAGQSPLTPAWRHDGQRLNFAELWEYVEQQAVAPGATLPATLAPIAGDAATLALGAYVASYRNGPFFPVDPSTPAPTPPDFRDLPPDTALLIATSGSEGEPKAIALSRRQLAAASDGANARLGLHRADVWLACLPLCHIGGQSILWRCARAAATLSLHDGFARNAVMAELHADDVTHISLVPAMLAQLLDAGCPPPPSLRVALIGGAALSPALHTRALAAGWPLWPSYGMTETAAMVACSAPGDPWQAGDVGKLLPGHTAKVDADGRLQLRGPQLPDDTWLRTGDLGAIAADGRLRILGRADDMLISAGRNVHPATVEACLAGLPGLREVAVCGRPDPVWGDRIVAVIVGEISDDTLIAHARAHLPAAAIPRTVLRVPSLPRTVAGKPDRRAIRQWVNEAPQ